MSSLVRWLDWSCESLGRHVGVLHIDLGVAESFSRVRCQRASAQSESDTFRSVSSAMACFTEEFVSMFADVGRIQKLIAHGAFEAEFVPFVAACNHFFSRID